MSKIERAKKLIELKENLPMGLLKMSEEITSKLDDISKRVKVLEDRKIPEAKEVSFDGLETMLDNFAESIITGVERKNGSDGKDGKDGIGRDGKDGADGKDGIAKDGKDGRDGIDGVATDGKDGNDGNDGSPDLPEEVRKKLEELKGEDRLDVKAIKNIEDIINKAVRTAKGGASGGGGGMGNSYHEVPSGTINGANTAFTITNPAKTNSHIVWVNGKTQVYGTDYTLSGKDLTMLWAIPTSSELTIWYIR